jgi:hypothetical protein
VYRRQIFRPRKDARFIAGGILPAMLDTDLARLESSVDPQLDHKGFRFELFLSGDLLRTLCQDMIEALFKPATLHALPLPVIISVQKDRVFARDDRSTLRQREHLVLHDGLHLASDLDDEFLSLAARFNLRIARGIFEDQFCRFPVDPTSNFFEYAQMFNPKIISNG